MDWCVHEKGDAYQIRKKAEKRFAEILRLEDGLQDDKAVVIALAM
jgi:hypothetical protein